MDPASARVSVAQGGVLTLDQALASHSPAQLRVLLRRGQLRRTPWRGVLVDGRRADDLLTLVRAASLWLGGDLVACRSTAAALWGFDLRSPEQAAADDLHFLAPAAVDNRRLNRLWVHPSSLGVADAVRRDGVWCTPPARTACDVARIGPVIDVLAVLDAALRSGTCTREDLQVACTGQTGLRGIVAVRELITHADGRAESPMESRMRWRFLAAGLPATQLQIEVGNSRRRHRIDLGWEEHRLGVEFDGLTAHMTREQLARDRERHNWLTERRWTLLHFTAVDVYRRADAMVAAVARRLGIPAAIMAP